jgi:hypothetical protein
MFLNKITDLFPWKIQSLLGYRPKYVLSDIKNLDSKKLKEGYFSYDIEELDDLFHCESVQPKPFSDLRKEKLLNCFSSFYCVELKNAIYLNVYGYDTYIENEVIIEPLTFRREKSFILGEYPKIHPALTIFKYPPKKILRGKTLGLSTIAAGLNYGHWTMDLIPKIGFVTKLGYRFEEFDYILINKMKSSYQEQMILALKLPIEKLIETDADDCYLCENLIVPSHDTFSMAGHSFLRNELAKSLNVSPKLDTPKRIYISRKNAKWARITNEIEILPFLEKHNFEIIQFEDYVVSEQINFMQNADFVIGVQGSGLINVVYQKKGSKLIEICDRNNIVMTYHIFSIYNSLKRGVVFAESVPNDDQNLYADMKIDVEKFKCLLNKMID